MHSFDETTARIMVGVMANLLDRLRMDPIPLDHCATPKELAEIAPSLINEEGNSPEEVLKIFTDVLAPRMLSTDSPRFLSFIPAAPTKASLLFDILVSAASLNAISWMEGSGAIWAENQVLRFLADAAGLPKSAGGCFVSGGSAANLSALAVARDEYRRTHPQRVGKLKIISSDQSHSSIKSTAHLLDCEVEVIPTNNAPLTASAIQKHLASSQDKDLIFALVGTTGTTNLGIIDDLNSLSKIAHEQNWWFHVDGAYGGAGLLAPSVRALYKGIEQADSFIIDPHKWLFAPFDCAALIYRNPGIAKQTHRQDAAYLEILYGDNKEEWNPTDYAHHLTRRARGLPSWFSLSVHGIKAYRKAIEASISLARSTAEKIQASDHLELIVYPMLSIVAFYRLGWNLADYKRWSTKLLKDQIGFVVPSEIDKKPMLRLAFLHPSTNEAIVDEILQSLI